MKSRKRTLIILAAGLLVLVLLTLLIVLAGRSERNRDVTITLIHSLTGDTAQAVEAQLRHYQNINPGIIIDIYFGEENSGAETEENRPVPDLIIGRGTFQGGAGFSASSPALWTGNLWTLAVNTGVVDLPAGDFAAQLEKARTPEEITAFLQKIKDGGITPIAVGNSHGWPLVLWDQHLQALTADGILPAAAEVFAKAESSTPQSWELLKSWMQKGFFLEETLNEGWARGLVAAAEGKAAMALMSGNMISTIPAEKRMDFLFLPFPSLSSAGRWAVGRGYSLTLNENSPRLIQVQKLRNYLTSPAVTDILSRQSGVLFYDQNRIAAARYIPSWAEFSNTGEMRRYMDRLKEYIRQ